MTRSNEWEITIVELRGKKGRKFKVTRRYPNLLISETKVFRSKKKAKKQFEEWLN